MCINCLHCLVPAGVVPTGALGHRADSACNWTHVPA